MIFYLNKKNLFLLVLISIFQIDLNCQFYNNRNLRQQLKSGTYNKTLVIPKGVLVVGKNATVKFTTGNGIIVEVGGTLYLDNCVITHANDNFTNINQVDRCGEFWNGIFVKGNPDSSQNHQYRRACNLIEICASYNNDGLDSMFGMGDLWDANIFDHNQGLVYMKKTRIRQAIIGINLGDVVNNISKQTAPTGLTGGGLLIATNCKFSNCHNSAISFAPYYKFINLSRIEDDTFECATKAYTTGNKSMRGIIASFNKFNFPINNNYFFRSITSIWSFNQDIYFLNCNSSIYNSKLQNLTQGIFMNTSLTSLTKSIEIYNNTATDCNNLVEVWESDLVSVYDNKITVKDAGNLGINYRFAASVLENCKDGTIRRNQFRPSNTATNMNSIGICIGANLALFPSKPITTVCFGNSITGLTNAIAHDQDARGNIPDCNNIISNLLFTSSNFDIGHTQFLFKFPLNYGSYNNPISNIFTIVSTSSNFKNLYSNNLAYNYWYNANHNKYDPTSKSIPFITKNVGKNKGNPCLIEFSESLKLKEPCGAIKVPISLKDKITSSMIGRKNLDSIGFNSWDYNLAKSKYMQNFQKLFQEVSIDYSDSLKSIYILKIDTLLDIIPDTSDYLYYSAFHYLLHKDSLRWNNLKTHINSVLSIHTELNYLTQYIDILSILIDSNFTNRNNLVIYNSLDSIQHGNSWVSGKAKSLFCYLYGLNCSSNLVNYSDTINLQFADSITYKVGPNPFDNSITISITNNYTTSKTVQLSISEFSSISSIFSNSLTIVQGSTSNITISTVGWKSDNYALLLNYLNFSHSEIIYKP